MQKSDFHSKLRKILHQIMPNLVGTYSSVNDLKFWKQEWERHGRHFGVSLDDYFRMIYFLYAHVSQDPQGITIYLYILKF